ncbi:MAG: hypothetical protein JKY56_10465, partial [Kofleriaceae bacterium]|nr:hypothetical protein [Kofleriaceae bacterium]
MLTRAIAAVLLLTVACGSDSPKETATASQTATAPAIDSPPALNQVDSETAAPQAEPTHAVEPTTTAAPKVVLSQLQQEERKSVLACED